jgi:hypothetical protein
MTHASKRQTVNIGLFRDGLLNVPKRLRTERTEKADRSLQWFADHKIGSLAQSGFRAITNEKTWCKQIGWC